MGFTGNKFFFLLCCVGFMSGFIYRILPLDQYRIGPPKKTSVSDQMDSNLTSEFADLLKLIDWPSPSSSITNFSLSTNPKECWYELKSPRSIYHVGETLEVLIMAKDHYGNLKSYGGDFFQAKVHSPNLKAGVTGHVKYLNNGTYLATFFLPWEGEAQVNIRLIHSSEAVSVLKDKRERHPDKVYFNGYFHFNGSIEEKECNIAVPGDDVCNYSDPVTGDPWQCLKPQKMPCDSLVYHSMGGYRTVTNSLEDSLLSSSVTTQNIKGAFTSIKIEPATNSKGNRPTVHRATISSRTSINVCIGSLISFSSSTHLPSTNSISCHSQSFFPPLLIISFPQYHLSFVGLTSRLQVCSPGQEPSQPSGFYYNDIWTSLVCLGRHFPSPSDARDCLKGKDIHMFGDSTLRQWFEYLEGFIPTLKRIDLHVNYQSGPLLAVDPDVGLVMRWRAHGNPLRTTKTMINNLHYEAAHLYGIGGGPQTVVVFTLWAHFTTYPVSVYIQRLFRLRRAISSLLFRSPETTVLIKSANTGYKSIYGSDWLSLQLDILLRAIFKDMAVTILDVWDMTSCHYLPDNIHPGAPVIRNEVDLMLSYICPR
ncbi:NXPE family member 3 isoform X1 [Xenopus laevis]|uniref:NXPE family member 3 isoform X1 n=1 Tax=Xenopus laevis TaxID=8355 RepID=A0A8J1MNG4_XENLA|nr:NXPE family member 3 isoform X1 [Xenopus laevis]